MRDVSSVMKSWCPAAVVGTRRTASEVTSTFMLASMVGAWFEALSWSSIGARALRRMGRRAVSKACLLEMLQKDVSSYDFTTACNGEE